MGSNKANWYEDETRREFVRFYRNNDLSMRKALAQFEFEGERTPSVATVWRWQNNIELEGDSEMAENEKDKSAVDKIIHGSQVSEGESNSSADNYKGGDNDSSKTETKERKKSGNSSAGESLDLSKATEWIKDHKMQIGLAAAGIAVVVLVSRFRHTVSVDELQGHGEGSLGESGTAQDDSSESEGLSDDGAWTGE